MKCLIFILFLSIVIMNPIFCVDGDAYFLVGYNQDTLPIVNRYGVYDMANPNNPVFLPNLDLNPYISALNVARDGVLFVTYLKDHSFVSGFIKDWLSPSLSINNLTAKTYNETGLYGAKPVVARNFLVDSNDKILLHQQTIPGDACYCGDSYAGEHSYNSHHGHLQDHIKTFAIGPGGTKPLTGADSFDYPHDFAISTGSVDDDFISAGQIKNEPFGQTVNSSQALITLWIPNATWYHQRNGTRTSQEVPGLNYPSVGPNETIHFRHYQIVDYNATVEEWTPSAAGPWQGGVEKINPRQRREAAIYSEAQMFRCADGCRGASPNMHNNINFDRSPYELAVGPMGTVYAVTPYDTTFRIWQSQAGAMTGLAHAGLVIPGAGSYGTAPYIIKIPPVGTPLGSWTIQDDISRIGFATRDVNTDWVYVSNMKDFAVGDNFTGTGGFCYTLDNNGKIERYKHVVNAAFQHTFTGPDTISPVWGAGGPPSIIKIGADGAGNLYVCGDVEPSNTWEWDPNNNTNPTPQWIDPNPADPTVEEYATGKLRKPYEHKLYKVSKYLVDEPNNPLFNAPEHMASLAAGYTTANGTIYRSKTGGAAVTPTVISGMEVDHYDPVKNVIRVDVAVVSDAGVEQSGNNQVDIEPIFSADAGTSILDQDTFMSNSGTKNNISDLDYIYCEDLDNVNVDYSWSMENDWVDYQWNYPDPPGQYYTNPPLQISSKKFLNEYQYKFFKEYQVLAAGYPYTIPPWLNGLHVNLMTQKYFEDVGWDGNKNGFVGGWSNNIVHDLAGAVTGSNGTTSTIEYCWEVYLLKSGGALTNDEITKLDQEDVSPYDPNNPGATPNPFQPVLLGRWIFDRTLSGAWVPSGDGQIDGGACPIFKYQFTDGGIYELRLRTRFFTYDYGKARVMPEFLTNPDIFWDTDGGNENGGWDSGDLDPNGYTYYYSSSKHGVPASKGLGNKVNYVADNKTHIHTSGNPNNWRDNLLGITAIRRVIVGKKPPETGTFACAEIVVKDDADNSAVPEYAAKGMFTPVTSGKCLVETSTDLTGIPTFISETAKIDEDYRVMVAGHSFVKYWTTVDEQLLKEIYKDAGITPDPNDMSTYNGSVTSDDFSNSTNTQQEMVADMLSGVIPGSVRFEWKVERGNGKTLLNLPSLPGQVSDLGGVTSEIGTGFHLYELMSAPTPAELADFYESRIIQATESPNSAGSLQVLHPYKIWRVPYQAGTTINLDAKFNIFEDQTSITLPKTSPGNTAWGKLIKAIPRGSVIAEFGSTELITDASFAAVTDPRLFLPASNALGTATLTGEVIFRTPSQCRDPEKEFAAGAYDFYDNANSFINKTVVDGQAFNWWGAATEPLKSKAGMVVPQKDEFVIALYVYGQIRKYDVDNPIVQEIDVTYSNPAIAVKHQGSKKVPTTIDNAGYIGFDNKATGYDGGDVTKPQGIIVGFKHNDLPEMRIAQAFYRFNVYDTTAPIVRSSFYRADNAGDLKTHHCDANTTIASCTGLANSAATTGDDLSVIIGVTIEDNNPYWGLDSSKEFVLVSRYAVTDNNTYDPTAAADVPTRIASPANYGVPPRFDTVSMSLIPCGFTDLPPALKSNTSDLWMNGTDHYSYTFLTYPEKNIYSKSPDQRLWPWYINANQDGFIHLSFMATDPNGNGMWTDGSNAPEIPMPSNADPVSVPVTNVGSPKTRADNGGDSHSSLVMDIVDNDPPEVSIGFQTHLYESWIMVGDQGGYTSWDEIGGHAQDYLAEIEDKNSASVVTPEKNDITDYAGSVNWGLNVTDRTGSDGFVTEFHPNAASPIALDLHADNVEKLHVYYTEPSSQASGLSIKIAEVANKYKDKFSRQDTPVAGWHQNFIFDFDQIVFDDPLIADKILGFSRDTVAGVYNPDTPDSALPDLAFEGPGFVFTKGDTLLIKINAEDNIDGRLVLSLNATAPATPNCKLTFKRFKDVGDPTFRDLIEGKDAAGKVKYYYLPVRFKHLSYQDSAGKKYRDFMTITVNDKNGNKRITRIPFRVCPTTDKHTTISLEKRGNKGK
ncbi:hypothetical protein KAJ27_07635 [bacterium]|nr:hypothetical protein [bacterium]